MKKVFLFILLLIAVYASITAIRSLPADGSEEILKSYSTWAGVVRVWVCDDLPGARRWAGRCAEKIAGGRSGIYIHVSSASVSGIKAALRGEIEPPDMVIWRSGTLDGTEGLCEVNVECDAREGLETHSHAVPLFTGGYVWAYRGEKYPTLPGDMYDIPVACRDSELFAMAMLSTGLREREIAARELPGVDIGLSGGQTTPMPIQGDVVCRASREINICDNPRRVFKNNGADAFIADFSGLGGMDVSIAATGDVAWAGYAALGSIPERGDPHAEDRRAVCLTLLAYMVQEGQKEVSICGALPAAAWARAYVGDPVYAAAEERLMNTQCLHPPYFGKCADLDSLAEGFVRREMTADECAALAEGAYR